MGARGEAGWGERGRRGKWVEAGEIEKCGSGVNGGGVIFENASASGHISFALMLSGLSIPHGAPVLNWNSADCLPAFYVAILVIFEAQ